MHQYSPDGDTSEFFYDRLGRLIVSQNREQKENASYSGAADRYSYTKYDGLGRITEVGEKSDAPDDIRTINLLDTIAVKDWVAGGIDKQLTKTIYDEPVNLALQNYTTSRKRVTASIYLENKNDAEGDSTIYSYDINGNVKTLLQHVKALVAVDADNGKKRIDYNYDLVSGKVNMVSYQHGKGDQFYYRYDYDADNRVVRSLSSRDKLIWTEDASYTYYLHGPLARTELGQYKVQGTDYAYTLQGWLKGINGSGLDETKEIGQDGKSATMFARVSRDVYGFSLGYYNNDYTPVGTGADALAVTYQPVTPVSSANSGNQLFNGNISYTTLALSKIRNGSTAGYTYNYDQLNRLTEMNRHNIDAGVSTWNNSSIIAAYKERISYDANGNILKYLRHGADTTAMPLDMDSLGYKYNRDVNGNLVNNRLNHVRDAVTSGNYTVDIDNQSANNYTYDRIGNLKTDVAEKIGNVNWTVYGKIKQVDKTEGSGTNTNIRNNYFRVETTTDGLNSNPSYTDNGGNTGFFVTDQVLGDKTTTASHEYGHTLGLEHDKQSDGSFTNIKGQPHIMATQVNNVDPQYQENVVKKDFTTPMLDLNKRKVTQKNIDELGLDKLKYDQNGKGKLGKLTNEYHTK